MSYPGYGPPQPPYGGQPPYGPPPGYGGPPGYPPPGYGYGPGYGRPQSFGIIGTVLAGIGAVLGIVAFTAVDWFEKSQGHAHFSDLKKAVDSGADGIAGFAHAYFDWLGWVLLIVAVLLAVGAAIPGSASGALRGLGGAVGALGVIATFLAIKLTDSTTVGSGPYAQSTPDYGDYLKHASAGFYLALAGFALVAIGAVIGPRTR